MGPRSHPDNPSAVSDERRFPFKRPSQPACHGSVSALSVVTCAGKGQQGKFHGRNDL